MSPPVVHPPRPVADVLEAGVDALLYGSAGWFRVPAGGYMGADWLTRKRCYRLHVDVTVGHELELDAALKYVRELAGRLEART